MHIRILLLLSIVVVVVVVVVVVARLLLLRGQLLELANVPVEAQEVREGHERQEAQDDRRGDDQTRNDVAPNASMSRIFFLK